MAKFLEIVDLYLNLNILTENLNSGNVFQTHVTFFVWEIGALFYETAVFNKSVHKTGLSDSEIRLKRDSIRLTCSSDFGSKCILLCSTGERNDSLGIVNM